MWLYKVCQGTKKRYTVVSSDIESKFDADEQARQFRFYNRKNTFVKRYSSNG